MHFINICCKMLLIYCAAGYYGADCSMGAGLPPVITGLRTGSACDARGPDCIFLSLFLIQFTFTDTFACKFVRISLKYTLRKYR